MQSIVVFCLYHLSLTERVLSFQHKFSGSWDRQLVRKMVCEEWGCTRFDDLTICVRSNEKEACYKSSGEIGSNSW